MEVESSVQLRVVEIDPWEDPRWGAFVIGHPYGTIYHHPAWLKALEREYRQRAVFLACEDPGGVLLGILPLLYTRGLPMSGNHVVTGPRLSSLPRTPLAGPLTVDPGVTKVLMQEAMRRVAAEPCVRLQIKAHRGELSDGFHGIVRKPWRKSYIVRLAGTPGQTYTIPDSRNRGAIRRGINKAIARGVRIRLADEEADLRVWYRLYLETMRRNLVASRPYRFFGALWDLMGPSGMMRLILAEHHTNERSRIIGGHIFFVFGDTVTYAFGASRSSDFVLRPNDMILWQAIQEASQNGFHFVDLGEVPEGDDDLARFKSKWGAELVDLYRYYCPDSPDTDLSNRKTRDTQVGLVKLIWRHMPLSITAWLGDRIYSFL